MRYVPVGLNACHHRHHHHHHHHRHHHHHHALLDFRSFFGSRSFCFQSASVGQSVVRTYAMMHIDRTTNTMRCPVCHEWLDQTAWSVAQWKDSTPLRDDLFPVRDRCIPCGIIRPLESQASKTADPVWERVADREGKPCFRHIPTGVYTRLTPDRYSERV